MVLLFIACISACLPAFLLRKISILAGRVAMDEMDEMDEMDAVVRRGAIDAITAARRQRPFMPWNI